jgi:hypothetical protein
MYLIFQWSMGSEERRKESKRGGRGRTEMRE